MIDFLPTLVSVEGVLNKIISIFNTELFRYGGTSLSIGLIIVTLVRWFFPKNKIIAYQERTISELEYMNKQLQTKANEQEARIQTLEMKMKVIMETTTNRKIREVKNINITPEKVHDLKANATKELKKVKVKVVKDGKNQETK